MKLFQQLLVAPAALGLLAPVAASASDLNIDGVSEYSGAAEQVSSVSRFSDVHPTDWAYQALNNLAERHGCVAGLPGGKFRGNQAITRYEAASVLNECLDRVTEVTDEVRRLVKEFDVELATIRGSVDGIEARVGEMEATQFSTTTTLGGLATYVIGANSFEGDAYTEGNANPRDADLGQSDGATTFSYDLQLELATSFTGDDSFITVLRSGNFGSNPFGGGGSVALATLETGYDSSDAVKVDKLFYSFPYSDDLTVVFGPLVGAEDMLAVNPSLYGSQAVLDVFTYAGAPGTYGRPLGGGAGVSWNSGSWDVSANYVSTNASNGNTSTGGGIMNEAAGNSLALQFAYSQESWGAAAAYNYASTDTDNILGGSTGTPLADTVTNIGQTKSYSLAAWWAPSEVGIIPTFSAGWGLNQTDDDDDSNATYDSATTPSWSVGMEWGDAFVEGNIFGMAFGQPNFVTDIDYDAATNTDAVADGNYAWEWWYAMQVSDNITVTPAIFYLSRPFGHNTDLTNTPGKSDRGLSNLGALVKTTFSF